ncbi:hypothetical protein ACTXT7_011566 [Hymenolepis weldensis]
MLSSLKSYIISELFKEEEDLKPSQTDKQPIEDSSRGSNERFADDKNDSFVSGLKEIISFASESSAKLAAELKSTAKQVSERIAASKPFVEFDRAHADFVAERKKVLSGENVLSTNILYSACKNGSELDEESHNRQQRIKAEVLRLSLDEQNFLRPPPHGSCFRWSPQLAALHMPLAMGLLNEDGNLASMRFKLVPRRMKEDDFWRNYFYRVSLIRQSENLPGEIHFSNETTEECESNKKSSLSSDNTEVDMSKGDKSQKKRSSTMSSPAALSVSSDSVDEIEAELMLEESDLENTIVIDEELENEILAELNGLEGKRDPTAS